MDVERAIGRVKRFIETIEDSLLQDVAGVHTSTDPQLDRAIRLELPLIQKIAEQIESGLGRSMEPRSYMGEWPWSNARDAAVRLLGILQGQQEAQEILAPAGPKLAANRLHPWVWEAAAKLWDDGHLRLAIQNAATAIDRKLQAKLSMVSKSGQALVTQAFQPAPPKANEKRLRLPQFVEGTEDWTSAHQGAMAFGQGCMLAIRNLATHRPSEPEEQMALEQLASLSVLARWIDVAEVVRG